MNYNYIKDKKLRALLLNAREKREVSSANDYIKKGNAMGSRGIRAIDSQQKGNLSYKEGYLKSKPNHTTNYEIHVNKISTKTNSLSYIKKQQPKKQREIIKFKSKRFRSPSTKDLAISTKQLSAMIRTGLPLLEALDIIAENTPSKTLSIVFKETAIGISRGSTMVEILSQYPEVFDEMFIALVSAGETAGNLPEVLDRQACLLESLSKIKSQIKTAMAYPITIFLITIAVVILMLLFVIPVFVDIYSSAEIELPVITKILIDLSAKITSINFYLISTPSCLLFYIFLKRLTKNASFKYRRDNLLLILPIFKDLITKSCLANFSRTLSALNAAGVPILESLLISKKTLGNMVFHRIIDRIYIQVQAGSPIYKVLAEQKYIPKIFTSMFRIGEETGELSQMITKLAEFYEDDVSSSVKSMTSILEPLMIVFVSLIVAIILIAMYLPMFSMMSTVS